MKKKLHWVFAVLICILSSCSTELDETVTYKINQPVFMSVTEFRNSVKVSTNTQTISKQGTICVYGKYLYICEPQKGIHIVDNSNVGSPKHIGFIEIIGNNDISITGSTLYADSYIDLICFDLSNPALPQIKTRIENAFRGYLPPANNSLRYDYTNIRQAINNSNIVVGWTVIEKIEDVKDYGEAWDNENPNGSTEGSFGNVFRSSASRFSIYENYLYTLVRDSLNIFNIGYGETSYSQQTLLGKIKVDANISNIFNYRNNLFLETTNGLVIYSLNNPIQPSYQYRIPAIFGCNHVALEDDMIYATTRSGTDCAQNTNTLFAINIEDVKNPVLSSTLEMENPRGLAIDSKNGHLFVCDNGLKIYDTHNQARQFLTLLAYYPNISGFDVIYTDETLMFITSAGLSQYDCSDIQNIKLISSFRAGSSNTSP